MRSALARRTFLGRLAAMPLVGAVGASVFAKRADAASSAVLAQIDAAERRCHDAKAAFEQALANFEASFPEPPACLLEWDRFAFTSVNERRYFDGEITKRGRDRIGHPCRRSIATVASLNRDLAGVRSWDRAAVKAIRGLRRHAARHEHQVRDAEKSFGLLDLHRERYNSQQDLEELANAIFERPATTLQVVRVQAHMLRAYVSGSSEQYAVYQAGRYGATLAANLDLLEVA